MTYHYVIVDYLCEYVSGTPRAGSDALEVALARPDELERFDLPAKALEVVQEGLARAAARGLARRARSARSTPSSVGLDPAV